MEILSILRFNTFIIVWQLFLLLWIISLFIACIDVARNDFKGNDKIFWLLLSIFAPFGGVIYFFIGRKQRIKAS